MLHEFRIGNTNFSLSFCRWKFTNFVEKSKDSQNQQQKHSKKCFPTSRLYQSSILLGDHIYMFGGVSSNSQVNFCSINLKNHKWHQLKPNIIPQSRDSHGLAVLKHEIYLFGGSDEFCYFNDLYSFNNFTNQWKLHENKGDKIPTPCDPMIFITIKNQSMLLIGGINMLTDDKYLEQAFLWKNSQWKSLKIDYPKGLILGKAVQVNGRVLLFGGMNRFTFEYNSTILEVVINQQNLCVQLVKVQIKHGITPQGRVNHSLVKINEQYILLVGGEELGGKKFKDIWLLDTFLLRWTLIQPCDGSLQGMNCFGSVIYNNTIYLMGGFFQNDREINKQVICIEFANQQIFKSQICENCVNIIQKKEQDCKKFPKDLAISVGFLYNMALEIKFPFQAISMIYEASTYFNAQNFRITILKNFNGFNYLKLDFDGLSFGRQQFMSFISHNFTSPELKRFTENIKLGSLRIGKTFLLISSDCRFRYIYLMSAQSRISPHFDEAYIYYCYIENLELQRIQSEEGIKQRHYILNILKQYLVTPETVLETQHNNLLLIFQPKMVLSAQRQFLTQLQDTKDDIKIWKSQKRVSFLEERGYKIQEDIQVSLKKWIIFYYLKENAFTMPKFYLNDSERQVPSIAYSEILRKFQNAGVIYSVDLPKDETLELSGELYITTHESLVEHNYGVLIYIKSRLYTRLNCQFGRLFHQNFYKSKYKKAKTIFYQLGYLNIQKGLQNNFTKIGFDKTEKYYTLIDKIQQKFTQKTQEITQIQQNYLQEQKIYKKIKL